MSQRHTVTVPARIQKRGFSRAPEWVNFVPMARILCTLFLWITASVCSAADEANIGLNSLIGKTEALSLLTENSPWYICQEEYLSEAAQNAVIINLFDQLDHSAIPENHRDQYITVKLPQITDLRAVLLKLDLKCPASGLCDWWDKIATLGLKDPVSNTEIEIARYVTPYRVPMCTVTDITKLSPLLHGEVELHSFIDTYVGLGHENGEGWYLSGELWYFQEHGLEESNVVEVINLLPLTKIPVSELGQESAADNTLKYNFDLDADIKKVEAHLIATGHGFGFTNNCAEFCELTHTIEVNNTEYTVNQWRSDCEENPISPQRGTWEYARNGWCPGAISVGNIVDISDAIRPGKNNLAIKIRSLNYEDYLNLEEGEGELIEQLSLKLYLYE